MSLDRLVDEMIRDAMARGEFDNLPGAGKPQNLDNYFAAPEDLRMAWTVLRNAGYLPEEVQLMKDIAALKARLAAAPSDAERVKLKKELDAKVLSLNVAMEQRQRARWATRRR
ncbi:MAG: DUF1992 domain-containing protein [Anaerolineae bacterium]|nr:DUF1992 domain-containing protein [Anaerolineae bacterium]